MKPESLWPETFEPTPKNLALLSFCETVLEEQIRHIRRITLYKQKCVSGIVGKPINTDGFDFYIHIANSPDTTTLLRVDCRDAGLTIQLLPEMQGLMGWTRIAKDEEEVVSVVRECLNSIWTKSIVAKMIHRIHQ